MSVGADYVVAVGDQKVTATAAVTGGWDQSADASLGTVSIPQAGRVTVSVRARDVATWKALNLFAVKLIPTP